MSASRIHLIHVPQMLVDCGAVPNINQGRNTLIYAALWMHGDKFDFNKKQVQVHRARLRQIDIDIKEPYSGIFYSAEESRKLLGIPEERVRKNASKKNLKRISAE
ncbi:phage/plasmid replication domain-containing protein [Metapseudomonas otitidis]|uniref:phage/plasmid replication domain-containing protein n=1 Tax=Metapseudomonas otitidis TaxID=319939 RepID=UPI003672E68D